MLLSSGDLFHLLSMFQSWRIKESGREERLKCARCQALQIDCTHLRLVVVLSLFTLYCTLCALPTTSCNYWIEINTTLRLFLFAVCLSTFSAINSVARQQCKCSRQKYKLKIVVHNIKDNAAYLHKFCTTFHSNFNFLPVAAYISLTRCLS